MSSYGFRISQPGYDVKSCSDLRCIITSKYPILKGFSEGTVNITATAAGVGLSAEGSVEINHNIGYIPVVRIFLDSGGEFYEIPNTDWQAGTYIFDTYYEHTSVNKITIYASLFIDGDTPSIDLDFKYYISLEKVNI